jgi:hypothetical protein
MDSTIPYNESKHNILALVGKVVQSHKVFSVPLHPLSPFFLLCLLANEIGGREGGGGEASTILISRMLISYYLFRIGSNNIICKFFKNYLLETTKMKEIIC